MEATGADRTTGDGVDGDRGGRCVRGAGNKRAGDVRARQCITQGLVLCKGRHNERVFLQGGEDECTTKIHTCFGRKARAERIRARIKTMLVPCSER